MGIVIETSSLTNNMVKTGGKRPGLKSPRGQYLRIPRPKRRRQIHHHENDPGPGKAHIRHGHSPWKNGEQQEPPLNPEGYRLPHRIPFLLRTSERQGKSAGHLHSETGPESAIDEVLQTVRMEKQQNKKVGQYSLGMKQRLGLAAALLGHPRILLLDEPRTP